MIATTTKQFNQTPRYRKPVVEASLDVKETVYSAPPLDLSFRNLSTFDQLGTIKECEPREMGGKKMKKNDEGKFCTTAVKLNNNHIEKWTGFDELINKVIANPEDLNWIDLSFNALCSIDDIVLKYPSVKILYLHGNEIENLGEVDKLIHMPNLKSVALHGNPIEQEKRYRAYMLTSLPQLRTMDFCTITKADRVTASVINDLHHVKNRKKRKPRDRSVDNGLDGGDV